MPAPPQDGLTIPTVSPRCSLGGLITSTSLVDRSTLSGYLASLSASQSAYRHSIGTWSHGQEACSMTLLWGRGGQSFTARQDGCTIALATRESEADIRSPWGAASTSGRGDQSEETWSRVAFPALVALHSEQKGDTSSQEIASLPNRQTGVCPL